MVARLLCVPIFLSLIGLTACGGPKGYEKAFSAQSALVGNSYEFNATPEQTFRTVKVTLVQQGFTIEHVDVGTGLIKAVRSLQDPKRADYAYLITATVDVTGQPSGKSTTVTVAASQQTVLHKDSEKYFHLLGLVPIPTGREHQTVVTKEGNIDKAGFYNDFFATVRRNLSAAPPSIPATAVAEQTVPLPAPAPAPAPVATTLPAPEASPMTGSAVAPESAVAALPPSGKPTGATSTSTSPNTDTLAPLEP